MSTQRQNMRKTEVPRWNFVDNIPIKDFLSSQEVRNKT